MLGVREEMCEVIEELYRLNLITATGGNVSVRAPDAPAEAWITPRGFFKGSLNPESMVRMDARGDRCAGAGTPSSESKIHAALLAARPDLQAVVHCHAPHATILVNTDLPFLPISTESAFLAPLGRIPFVMPGTEALADALVRALGQGWGVLMKNHGLIVGARTLRRAADLTQIIERTAEIILGCYAVGREPPVLPEEVVKELSRKPDLMA
ncbi:MAG TPA: class II aldolase/adducin family protein [Polyangiales bacterium]